MKNVTIIDILLVEDNPRDAELTVRTLTKNHIANNIFVVTDGEDALDFLFCRGNYSQRNPCPPRVIFLDIKLPKLNGLEVLKIIKSEETLRQTPIVMLTSSAEDPDINTAYALGANSYVVKPVDFTKFSETIKQLDLYWLVINRAPK
jgi:two-component system, response regulator